MICRQKYLSDEQKAVLGFAPHEASVGYENRRGL